MTWDDKKRESPSTGEDEKSKKKKDKYSPERPNTYTKWADILNRFNGSGVGPDGGKQFIQKVESRKRKRKLDTIE